MGRERLFGFRLQDASAVILFIFAVGLLIIGFYEMYNIYTYYNATNQIPVAYTIIMIICMTLGMYILFKTLQYRKTTIRG